MLLKSNGVLFSKCSSLTSIVIPDSVSKVGERVFEECSALKNVTLSKKAIVIPNRMFANCTDLTSIFIPAGTTVNNPGSSWSDYCHDAFYGCSKLTDLMTEDSNLVLPENAFRETPWLPLNWRNKGLCDLCGGKFKGLVVKKCLRCGKSKQY